MKGHRNDGVHVKPKVFFRAQGLLHIASQIPAQTLEPAVLVKQDDILDDALIPAARPMLGKRGSLLQTTETEMRLSRPLKKAAATQAIGIPRPRLDFFLTAQTENAFPGFLEEGLTDFAKRGIEEDLCVFAPGGEQPAESGPHPFSSSIFC
jgi:hypothetical protein